MKKYLLIISLALSAAAIMGCDGKSKEEKIQEQITEKQYALTADDRARLTANAKQYFEKAWVIADNKVGQLNNCNPTDSNANGLVSCVGFVPQAAGVNPPFKEVKMYCSYRPEVVGCNPEDKIQ